MKKFLFLVTMMWSALYVPALFAHTGCDHKLDALSHTVLSLVAGADEVNSELTSFSDTCCSGDRGVNRAPSCSCATTPITAAGKLFASGAYCLANDITGDIDAAGLQVKINLNGHTVTGNVTVGDSSYVYGGTITGRLTVGSLSHVEGVTLGTAVAAGSLYGSTASNVLVNDLFFPGPEEATISGFESLTLDRSILHDVNCVATKELIVRHTKVLGTFGHTDDTLERLFFYDTTVQGPCPIRFTDGARSLGVWNSSFQGFDISMNVVTAPYPIISLYGSTFARLALLNSGSALGMVGLIDECSCGIMSLSKLANVRCQNTVVNAQSAGIAVTVTDCQQMTFDHVQAYSEGGVVQEAFAISGGQNILLKQCLGVAGEGEAVAFDCDDSDDTTLTNLNLYECVAKNSNRGFWFGSETMTGTVIRCVADSCDQGFVAKAAAMKMVFVSNLGVANTTNNYAPATGDPFNSSNDPMTAVSWRNMGASTLPG